MVIKTQIGTFHHTIFAYNSYYTAYRKEKPITVTDKSKTKSEEMRDHHEK
jgi:hypothetical protein